MHGLTFSQICSPEAIGQGGFRQENDPAKDNPENPVDPVQAMGIIIESIPSTERLLTTEIET